ncbi:MAG: helix-turn-helix domain-containing protein [Oscillospiraceae bacterium]|nr:helix-turn-helix domain-containing protein [Oscillospiraceae bacterium]
MNLKFGERIREVRNKSGFTQKEFGALLDIPQTTLSAYETDRMQPTIISLVAIAVRFGVSLDWLCGIESNPSNDLYTSLNAAEKLLQEWEARQRIEMREMKKLRKALLAAKSAALKKERD